MCLFLVLAEALILYIVQILKYFKVLMTFSIEKKIKVMFLGGPIFHTEDIQDIHKQTLTRQCPNFNFQYKKDLQHHVKFVSRTYQ